MVLVLAHVQFAAKDGLDSLLLGGVEKVNGAVNVAVVGHGDGLLAELGDAVDQLGDVAGPVEERVFGMQMKVGEFRHGSGSILVLEWIPGLAAIAEEKPEYIIPTLRSIEARKQGKEPIGQRIFLTSTTA